MGTDRSSHCIQVSIAAVCICALGLAGGSAAIAAGACPNEALREGRSASLPDCRAYELVTPKNLGRTGAMSFKEHRDSALPSSDGEHLALLTFGVFFEPGLSVRGTTAVFSRTSSGWVMGSISTAGLADKVIELQLFSPDLSQVAFASIDGLTQAQETLESGPVGGPYAVVATVSGTLGEIEGTAFAGTNSGTPAVPAFNDLLFDSVNHTLLPPGREREAAERARPGAPVLYEWTKGQLRLVNVDNAGNLLSPCGARLGFSTGGGQAMNAVSDDGSKVFFTSPMHEPGCLQPALYMRVGGGETVDVSEPEGVSIPPEARSEVKYDGASNDGSRVFFTTATALTPAAVSQPGFKLYEYDTEAPSGHRLILIANEVAPAEKEFVNPYVVISEDGTVVYYQGGGVIEVGGHSVDVSGIWYYNTATRKPPSFVATPQETTLLAEPYYTTPQGEFLVFPSGRGAGPEVVGAHGLEEEYRGAGHEELYRYDAIDGSVICVSCGEGVAPARGSLSVPEALTGVLEIDDGAATVISISDDGRRVFFQTSAMLVPQDTNEDSVEEEDMEEGQTAIGAGADVYEWEQLGTEEEPGVFCHVAVGCTHLISAGEAVGPERFLGASASGDDVFFMSAAQLTPEATPEIHEHLRRAGGWRVPAASARGRMHELPGGGERAAAIQRALERDVLGRGQPAPASWETETRAETEV